MWESEPAANGRCNETMFKPTKPTEKTTKLNHKQKAKNEMIDCLVVATNQEEPVAN